MFKKSDKNIHRDLISEIPSILEINSLKQYNDTNGWHNQFHKQITLRIDESSYTMKKWEHPILIYLYL